jgi:hypothetical protein
MEPVTPTEVLLSKVVERLDTLNDRLEQALGGATSSAPAPAKKAASSKGGKKQKAELTGE